MIRIRIVPIGCLLWVASIFVVFGVFNKATAEPLAACNAEENTVEAITQTPFDNTYKIYLHIDILQPGANYQVELNNAIRQECNQIGVADKAADGWLTGVYRHSVIDPVFFAKGLIWNNVGEGKIDGVMLVSPDVDCSPKPGGECVAKVKKDTVTYWPKLISEDGDTIKVSLLLPQSSKSIDHVITYVDRREAYRKNELTPIDTAYMLAGEHLVERHVFNTDGTKAVYSSTINSSNENLSNYYYVYINPHLRVLKLIGYISGGFLTVAILLSLLHAYYRHRLWQEEHFPKL